MLRQARERKVTMTNYYVTYVLKDKETRDAFYKEVKEGGIIDASVAEEGCIRYEYFYPADSDDKIFLWEQWESRQAQAIHKETPHFAALTALKEKYHVEADIIVEDAAEK